MNKLNFLLSLLLITFLAFSCKKDDDDGSEMEEEMEIVETTIAQDQQNIQASFDDGIACTAEMKNGKMVTSLMREFLDLADGEVLNDEWIDQIFTNFDNVVNVEAIDDNNRFDLSFYEGTYTFNHADFSWSKSNLNNKVVIEFPSSPIKNNNNAKITVENYSDTNVTIEQENLWLPKQVDIKIEADGEEIIRVDLNNVEYANNADFEIPIAVDLNVYMNPFNMSLKVDRTTATDFEVDMAMASSSCTMSARATVELNDSDFENLNEDSFKEITIELGLNDLKVQTLTGLADLIKLDDPTENQINSVLDLDVLFNNMKIADLKFDDEAESLILVYKDGITEEDSQIYYQPFVDQFEALIQEFTGPW